MRIWSVDVRSYLTLALFILLVLGGGTLIGLMTLPGEWYAGLAKPPFNPPNWIFAPVWTLLYIMVAVAGWRTWQRGPRSAAMAVWFIQLALNFVWSPVFFGAHRIGGALAVIVALLAAIIAFIVMAWPRDRIAALLFTPYAAWVAFATLLNGALWYLN
jgi:benzodiazapine receptor